MQTFFGVEVVPGKLTPFVPPPIDAQLHLSQATLSLDAKAGERVGVTARVDEDGPDVLICSLREGTSECQNLDLIFDSYAEFKVVGNASVHLSGYYMPEHDEEDYDEDEEDEDEDEDEEDTDEDEELGNITAEDLKALAAYGRKHGLPDAADDEDEDDDEDDEEDDDEDNDEDDQAAARNTIVIRELNHDGSERADTDEDDDEEEDEDEDDEVDAEDAVVAPGGGVQIDEDIAPETAGAVEAPSKRKSAAAQKGAPVSKKAKKAADIAKAVADDLIMQAMEEEDNHDKEHGKVADDIIDMAAASAGPAVEDVTAPAGAAAELEVVEAEAAGQKPLSKKEKKRRAKEAAANGQIAVEAAEPGSASVPIKHTRPKVQKFDNGFIIEDTHMGPAQGKEAKPGNKVGVRYKGWLAKNNKVFDQTKGSKTFNFRVGVGEVIKGWDRGVVGMRAGDKRRLTVPPQMAYGTTGVSGAIPGNATLVFDVELVDVKEK